MIKNGTRLQSQVCDTQVIVVRTSDALDATPDAGLRLDEDYAGGTLMGKRYVDADGSEILVTKAGKGTLSIGSTPLQVKEAKPLPASD